MLKIPPKYIKWNPCCALLPTKPIMCRHQRFIFTHYIIVCVQNRRSWPPFHLWPIFTVPNTEAAFSEVYLAGIISAKLTRISQLAHGMRLIPSLWHFKLFKWESHPFIFQHSRGWIWNLSQSLTHAKLLVLEKCGWHYPCFWVFVFLFFSVSLSREPFMWIWYFSRTLTKNKILLEGPVLYQYIHKWGITALCDVKRSHFQNWVFLHTFSEM